MCTYALSLLAYYFRGAKFVFLLFTFFGSMLDLHTCLKNTYISFAPPPTFSWIFRRNMDQKAKEKLLTLQLPSLIRIASKGLKLILMWGYLIGLLGSVGI